MSLATLSPFLRYVHEINLIPAFTTHRQIACDQRLFFCLEGAYRISAGGETYDMSRHALLFVPAGTPYRLHRPQERVRLIGVNFDWTDTHRDLTTPIPPVFDEKQFRPDSLLDKTVPDGLPELEKPFFLSDASSFFPVISRMLEEYNARRLYYLPLCAALLKEWAIQFAREIASPRPDDTAERIISFLQENYRRPLSNGEIARALNFHPNYLSRILKRHTGQSLHQYLLSLRLNKAMSLLQSTSLTVSRIAQEVGFGDVQQFSKSFSLRFGAPPGAFR